MIRKLKKGEDTCPFIEGDTLKIVPYVKPTRGHENYNIGDITEVMFFPEQEVLIFRKKYQ